MINDNHTTSIFHLQLNNSTSKTLTTTVNHCYPQLPTSLSCRYGTRNVGESPGYLVVYELYLIDERMTYPGLYEKGTIIINMA